VSTPFVKTASDAKDVQVLRYQNNRKIVLKHIGSAHNENELKDLMYVAEDWIRNYSGQLSFFSDEDPNKLLHLDHSSFLGVKCTYFNRQNQRIDPAGDWI